MDDFKAVLAEGVFTRNGMAIHGPRDTTVEAELRPLVGKRVRLAMHHLPPNLHNLNPDKWGGGSCLWQPSPCPAGHHERPDYLFNLSAEGVLWDREKYDGWCIERLDGTILDLPFRKMAGHHGRLAAATLIDVEKMRDALTPEALAGVEGLSVQADALREMLERMRR
jgi:hypothetical protein